ncbi:MAG: serine O-acetyltransferase [Deltaproteobacteria bacterium]
MAPNVAVPLGPVPGPSPFEAFRADRKKYYRIAFGTDRPLLRQRARLWLTNQGFQCVAVYRLGTLARRLKGRRRGAWLICGAAFRALDTLMGLLHHVAVEAEIGPGFYIGHPSTIYIGKSRIGSNFSVTHNVTIGVGHSEGAKGHPAIGSDVWVGTGSTLFGAIEVGDGTTVASGTVLSQSVPPRSFVGGNPGRVIRCGYDNRALFRSTPEAESRPDQAREKVAPP